MVVLFWIILKVMGGVILCVFIMIKFLVIDVIEMGEEWIIDEVV